MDDHTATIRVLRAQSNAAIAARDADRTVSFMAPDVTVHVAGGPTLRGPEASRDAFAAQFNDPAFDGYVRSPAQVTLLEAPHRAMERGRWTGRWRTRSGVREIGGAYTAEWRPGPLGWQIVSEAFSPD